MCFLLLRILPRSKEHIDITNLTIEHILPQKENAIVWKKEVGDDYNRVYEIYLHTLGNLTITGHNSELGTKSFTDKKNIICENSKANVLNKEVLSAERWDESSILNRAKVLSNILIDKFNYVEMHSDISETNELSFGVNSGIDFSNTKPEGFSFVGEYTKVASWADLLTKFISLVYDLDTEMLNELAKSDYSIPNADRTYISNDERKLRKAKQVDNSGIFFETNLSSNNIISFIKDLLSNMNLDIDDFSFSLSKAPFDIDDENTWSEGMLPVAKLFYNLVEDLINKSKITVTEVENLKTKEYTKSLFKATNYPAFADNVTDNMGNSSHKRYRAKELHFNDMDIYISTQFFESDREAVISWYKEHLN